MKIIDFDRKGNAVRFYLGDDDCVEYWGDDWDDDPLECNAGSVYHEYVKGWVDVYWPLEYEVLSPDDETYLSKADLKEGLAPCVIAMYEETAQPYNYAAHTGDKNAERFYFEDSLDVILNTPHGLVGKVIQEADNDQ